MLNAKTKKRLIVISAIALCLVGAFLRIYFFIVDRSLWLDESKLSLNIVDRSFLGLFQPLANDQAAPIAFLLLQKAVVSILGGKDIVFRVIPLLAGLASLPLMYWVAKKYAGQWAAFISLGLMAFSSRLIYYSSEAKQYSSDVLASLVLLLIVPPCLEDQAKPRAFVVLGIAGAVSIWLSQPSCFVFAGILATLGLVIALRRDWHHLYWVIGIGAAWGLSLALDYLISLRNLAANKFLYAFWQGSFAPLPPWSHFSWYIKAFTGMLRDPATLPIIITTVLLVLGIYSFASRRWPLMLIVVAPFLLALAASALDKYPFSGRLLLFLLPLLFLLLAAGVEQLMTWLAKINKPGAWLISACLVAYLLYGPVKLAYADVKFPPMGEDIKPVMTYLGENYRSTDLIYIFYAADPAFEFYAPQYGLDHSNSIVGISSRQNPAQYFKDIDKLKGHPRVWFVFSHIETLNNKNERDPILKYLDGIGVKKSEFIAAGASVYLYDLEQAP
jgi:hypothetical protein